MKNIVILIIILFSFNECAVENNNISVIDCDCINPKLNYDTVKICDQVWMEKNLDVDHYQNCDSIPQVTDPEEWVNLKTGAWCYYNNDSALGAVYGKLYNWYALNDPRGLAPKGWHLPSDEEWKSLEMCLGMSKSEADKEDPDRGTNEGGKLKEIGTPHWKSPNYGATNSCGFTALPGGWRYNTNGSFNYIGIGGGWWASTEIDSNHAWVRSLGCNVEDIGRWNHNKKAGFSVRCVKD